MMKLLLTNDDGIEAEGLQALHDAARHLGEVLVVAPAEPHSGCAHRVTTDGPFRVTQQSPGRYVVAGTPADCVRVALHALVREPIVVLSGINAGGNLGADVHISGTVAAAREAVLHGQRGVAVSQYKRKGMAVDWRRSTRWVGPNLEREPAEPRGDRAGPGGGVLPRQPAAIAVELPPRRRVIPLRRRLPRPAAPARQRRGRVLRGPHRRVGITALLRTSPMQLTASTAKLEPCVRPVERKSG
jgi:hypothetical protein